MDMHPLLPSEQDESIHIDTTLLGDVVRRNLRRMLVVGAVVCGAFTTWQLCFVPQAFKAEVSIAMQQSGSFSGGLSTLLGGSTQSKKYIGLLRSRSLAETVEQQVHLQALYHLKTHHDALETLIEGMRPEDSPTDGLLFVRLTLPGPPALAPNAGQRRDQVRKVVAQGANLYAKALADYYDASNTERDNVLLKAAETETRRARHDYQQSTDNIRAFVRSLNGFPMRSTPSGTTVESGGGSQDLSLLYQEEDRIAAEIRAAEAIQQTQRRLTAVQLQNLNSLPAEDILLNDARAAKNRAQNTLKRKLDVFGPDNLQVKDAQDALTRANEELDRQKAGIKDLLTTDQVELSKKLEGLRAKQETIQAHVASMEGNVSTKRGLTTRLELLRNEQMLALKELEQAIVKSVEVRLTAVSGKSMITIVDLAEPPRTATPSKLRTLLLGGILGFLVMIGTGLMAYFKQARHNALAALQFAVATQNLPPQEGPLKNGNHTTPLGSSESGTNSGGHA